MKRKFLIILGVGLVSLWIYLFATSFNKEIFKLSDYEKIVQQQRRVYFGQELGRIYGNRIGVFYFDNVLPATTKISISFISNLSWLPLAALGLLLLITLNQKIQPIEKITKRHLGILILVFFVAGFLRLYNLDNIPAGLHGDAASQGYNAFSLLQTGKDRYGEPFPILFRSLGSYQPPVYTYLTTVPVTLFGNTAFSARFISAISGILLGLITFLFLRAMFPAKFGLALLGAGVIAIAPWSVFFSRLAVEANLALLIFASSIFLFWNSLKKPQLFISAAFLLGVSTHAYYSERLTAVIFLPIFLLLFKKVWLNQKRWVILGLIAFLLTQIPHFSMISTGAYIRRFDQVSNTENYSLLKTFFDNYLVYYSPANLFFDSDSNLGRTMPGLSVFYTWMILPFILGLRELFTSRVGGEVKKLLLLLLILTPVSAGLTGDLFYPLRTLDFLWILTLIISIGIYNFFTFLRSNFIRAGLAAVLISYSLFPFTSPILFFLNMKRRKITVMPM